MATFTNRFIIRNHDDLVRVEFFDDPSDEKTVEPVAVLIMRGSDADDLVEKMTKIRTPRSARCLS